HYVLWRMFDNRGCLIGTLFHICTDVVITDTSVSYLDLLLDIWITPQGQIRIFDEDELQECVRAGLIDKNEQRIIETQKQTITSGFDHIINKILEDTLQIDIPSAVPPGGGLSHP
ncbi:MAG: DUF402 domain-containing protein, partial [Deltaproteobacteria bacterium]|nr:DUF402 domain-containing protein [Deltaproteobacteria bacterium]